MSFEIKHVANTFLQKDFEDGKASITPMKMQKLIYFLHGWHLAITGEPVVKHEFRAWQYGPVEEHLYHLLKKYRGSPISSYLSEYMDGEEKAFVVSSQNDMFYKVFEMVWNKYSHFSAIQLSALTHQAGSPWDTIYNHQDDTPCISDNLIKKYFENIINA